MKKQCTAPDTVPMNARAFEPADATVLYWLAGGGFMLNSRGTILLLDPVLSTSGPRVCETGKRMLVDYPIGARDIPRADAVLYTHTDDDHLGPVTASVLINMAASSGQNRHEAPIAKRPLFISTPFVIKTLLSMGAAEECCTAKRPGEVYSLGGVTVELTPADHAWQEQNPSLLGYVFGPEDCCGFLIKTADGCFWFTGDTRLMKAHQTVKDVDVLALDASRDKYHLGVQGSITLANQLETAQLIPYHYGTYDEPEHTAFNGDPDEVLRHVINAEQRTRRLAPGEPFIIKEGRAVSRA